VNFKKRIPWARPFVLCEMVEWFGSKENFENIFLKFADHYWASRYDESC